MKITDLAIEAFGVRFAPTDVIELRLVGGSVEILAHQGDVFMKVPADRVEFLPPEK